MSRSQAVDPRWETRARRARALLPERPHAEPLLRFYLSLLELQAPLWDQADATRWLPAVGETEAADLPRLRLERLPLEELAPRLSEFCRAVAMTAPAPVALAAHAVSSAGGQTRTDLLSALLTGSGVETLAGALGCAPAPLAFLPRGFLTPLAEALSDLVMPPGAARTPTCPQCGWPPQVSVLDDEPDAHGTRRLVCALCATAWVFPRATCPACGESGAGGVEFHVDDTTPHVRVEACRTCRRYVKSVDLRVSGLAVPLVDDLATVELDLWAAEQGLEKIVPNLFDL